MIVAIYERGQYHDWLPVIILLNVGLQVIVNFFHSVLEHVR